VSQPVRPTVRMTTFAIALGFEFRLLKNNHVAIYDGYGVELKRFPTPARPGDGIAIKTSGNEFVEFCGFKFVNRQGVLWLQADGHDVMVAQIPQDQSYRVFSAGEQRWESLPAEETEERLRERERAREESLREMEERLREQEREREERLREMEERLREQEREREERLREQDRELEERLREQDRELEERLREQDREREERLREREERQREKEARQREREREREERQREKEARQREREREREERQREREEREQEEREEHLRKRFRGTVRQTAHASIVSQVSDGFVREMIQTVTTQAGERLVVNKATNCIGAVQRVSFA
jgi:hypothetical protein